MEHDFMLNLFILNITSFLGDTWQKDLACPKQFSYQQLKEQITFRNYKTIK